MKQLTCVNKSEVADCDEFICSNCGIDIVDWTKRVIYEDNGDELFYEYTFKFCPECGHKVVSNHDE